MSAPPRGMQRVLVTGGGGGIGRAVVEGLVRAGGRVAVVGRRQEPLEELARAFPGQVQVLACDVADATAREGLLARARAQLGGLDGLVYAAGVVHHQPPGAIPEDALREQLEVNLVAPLRLGEQALVELEEGGAMVFLASTLAHRPVGTSAVYSATKAGLLSLVRSLAGAGAPRRVRVSAVSPGVVDTQMVRALRLAPGEVPPPPEAQQARVEAQLEALRALHPLGRLGSPADVADAVLHLLQAPWTTGAELVVDGGLLL